MKTKKIRMIMVSLFLILSLAGWTIAQDDNEDFATFEQGTVLSEGVSVGTGEHMSKGKWNSLHFNYSI